MSRENEILRVLERERLARKESERILEARSLEIYEQKLEIKALQKALEEGINRKFLEINKRQKMQDEVFEVHPFSIFVYSLKTLKILNVNNTAVCDYGYSKSEFYNLSITDLHFEEDKKLVIDHIESIRSGSKETKIWNHVKKNGSVAIVKMTGVSIEFDNEQARIVVVEDITRTKLLEEKNELQQKKYADLIEKSSDLIFGMSLEGNFLFVNGVTCKLTGYSESELMLKNFKELVRPDYQNRVVSFYKFQLESRTENTYSEFPILSKQGEEIWLGQNVNLSQDESGSEEISVIARVITERKIFEKALLRSEDKFRSMIENMELGLLETDRDGKIVKAYDSFCAIVGYSPGELEGGYADFLLNNKSREILKEQQNRRSKGETGVYELQLICKDGSKKWVVISGVPFYDQNNRFAGTIGIHLDITDRKIIENQLIEAKNTAEVSLRTKEVFLANISHEIRTPLNAVIGLSQVLKTTDLDSNQREMIIQVSTASSNLLNLINDILLFSKTEANGIQLNSQFNSLIDSISDTVNMFTNSANEKKIQYECELNITDGYLHYFDKLRLTQIIQNLISNAIKFTNEGYVKLIASNKNNVEEVEIRIEDSGIGIPDDELKSIFNEFTQAKNNNPQIYGGTGLGLSIVNNIVKLMGGAIRIEKLDDGTCFILNFKFSAEKVRFQEIFQVEKDMYNKINLEGIHVLVVEDNDINQMLIRKILSGWNVEFTIANDGKKALDEMDIKDFDIILMDIRMPVMNGIEATYAIRNNLKKYYIPIIALTANTVDENNLEYWEAGFNDVLLKPFNQEDLFNILVRFLKNRSEDLRQKLNYVSQGDLSFAETLKTIFVDDSLFRMANMKSSVMSENFDEVRSIAHSMKPSIQQLGSKELFDLVRAIEIEKLDAKLIVSKVETFELRLMMLIEELKKISF